jgi:hypothetical protein
MARDDNFTLTQAIRRKQPFYEIKYGDVTQDQRGTLAELLPLVKASKEQNTLNRITIYKHFPSGTKCSIPLPKV